ncbi:restriction endonuclease subunit S [Campylobacter devanensis]|uniref:restriction endonuclease subunit S n=1 Tax=Campylobacter devanensis TaxID=3161138 RepID=UPI001F3F557C|nr:restriction endonuclease subunit S [Campylobacter sp. P0023]
MFEKLPFNKLRYKKADLPSNKINDFVLPAITCTTENNGISCYVKKENATIFKNCISVAANGDAPVFYQSNEFTILQDAYVIDFKDKKLNKKENLFFTALLKKALKKFDWANKSGWERVKNENILLPTTQNGEIDFEFMESFVAELEAERVAELEAERVAELEAYLAAASLKDYELTADELSALSKFENYNWGEFRIGDLFERLNTKKLPYKAKDLPVNVQDKFNLPCLTSSFNNQGLNYFAPREGATILKNVISLPSNSDVYRGYFQSRDFTVLSDAYVIDWINKETKHKIQSYLFSLTSINKVTDLPIYSYKNKLGGWNVVRNKLIQLPINKDGDINFEFMNNFIKAIEKLVIKDVVLYTDNKIKATKSIVSSNQ